MSQNKIKDKFSSIDLMAIEKFEISLNSTISMTAHISPYIEDDILACSLNITQSAAKRG